MLRGVVEPSAAKPADLDTAAVGSTPLSEDVRTLTVTWTSVRARLLEPALQDNPQLRADILAIKDVLERHPPANALDKAMYAGNLSTLESLAEDPAGIRGSDRYLTMLASELDGITAAAVDRAVKNHELGNELTPKQRKEALQRMLLLVETLQPLFVRSEVKTGPNSKTRCTDSAEATRLLAELVAEAAKVKTAKDTPLFPALGQIVEEFGPKNAKVLERLEGLQDQLPRHIKEARRFKPLPRR